MMTDGSFEICGRCDSMVKIRGYSVETQVNIIAMLQTWVKINRMTIGMGAQYFFARFWKYLVSFKAIEAALLELSMVNACVVVVMGEEGEDKYLVAYVVPEGKTNKKDIRAALKRRLPFYMIPSYFVLLNR